MMTVKNLTHFSGGSMSNGSVGITLDYVGGYEFNPFEFKLDNEE